MLPDLKTLPEWHAACRRYRYNITRFAVEALNMTEAAGQAVTPQQELLFDSIVQDGSRTSVASGHGCFGRNTMVRLANGKTKRVKNIKLSDKLLGADGKTEKEILELVRGTEPLYRFVYQDGTHHVFNESHILCLKHVFTGKPLYVTVRQYLSASDAKRKEWAACRLNLKTGQYRNLAIVRVKSLGMGKYYGFMLDGDHQFLAADGTVLHNTGKTRSAGIVALWHLLFFPDSVMMFTAPQIGQLRKLVWKEISICKARMLTGRLAWLAEYITVLAETVYIKGHEKTWHVIAKTAPKNRPENLAGQHGDNYFFWGDEACAIENEVFDVALGALTHKNNRAVLTSQPARPSGFFFDTHHSLSIAAGGVWNNLTFNGELSPLVSRKTILEMLMKYGSRDDPGYMIRVRGLFPDLANEFLVTRSAAASTYAGTCIFDGKHDDYGYFIVVDVGGGVGRDDSVVGVAKVWGDTQYGERARRVEIVKIPLCKNNDNLHELTGVIDDCLATYPNATILLDAIGAGSGLSQHLTSKGIYYEKVNWSGACFSKSNKEMYANKRSQAYVCLKKAIDQGRFKITVPEYRNKVQEQITRIPYIFDDKSRFKIQSKEDMRKRGIKSPDIADIFAFCFLEGFYYTSANEVDRYFGDSHARDEFDELDEALKRAG